MIILNSQQERHRHHWCEENSVLNIHCSTHNQSNTLGNKRYQQASSQEHSISEQLHGLGREIVNDRHVDETKDRLEEKVKSGGNKIKSFRTHLERNVRYCYRQVVASQRIPSIKVLLQQNRHFERDWKNVERMA